MKKLVCTILCVILLLCAGCNAPASSDSNADSNGVPPACLIFSTMEIYNSFLEMKTATNEELNVFLNKKTNFGVNEMDGKEDLIKVEEKLNDVVIPVIDGYKINYFQYFPEYDNFRIFYLAEDGTWMRFARRFDRDAAEAFVKENEEKNKEHQLSHRSGQDMTVFAMKIENPEWRGFLLEHPDFIGSLSIVDNNIDETKSSQEAFSQRANDKVSNQLTFEPLSKIALDPDMWAPEK